MRMRRTLSGGVAVVALAMLATQLVAPGAGLASAPGPALAAGLSTLSNDAFAQLSQPDELGVDVSYTGVDSAANVVEIGVVNYTPEIAQQLESRFGAQRVRVVPARTFRHTVLVTPRSEGLFAVPPAASADRAGIMEGRYCDGFFCVPTRGGVLLQQEQGDFIYSCTSTIVGTSWNNRNSTLSAGHCFDQNEQVYYGTVWLNAGVGFPLGHVNARQFGGGSDHAIIEWSDPNGISNEDRLTNCIFIPGVDCTRVTFHASPGQGAEITQRGVTTGRTIGRVLLTSVNVDIEDDEGIVHHMTDMLLTSACSLPGDSGGAAFAGAGLVGTISAGNFLPTNPPSCAPSPQSLISKSLYAFSIFGFQPRFTP
jgi:trypsin